MERACHQCGNPLSEGSAFCFKCGAPQIRVSPPQETPAPEGPSLSAPDPVAPETPQPVSVVTTTPPPSSQPAIVWSQAMPGLLLAGFGMAIVSSLPLVGVLCCLWALAGGAGAVAIYGWRTHRGLTTGMGARIGAVTGLAGFIPFALIFVGKLAFKGKELREAMRKGMEQAVANNPDPNAGRVAEWFATPGGTATLITIMMVMFLFVFVVFSTAGGAIGAALFGQKGEGASSESP